MGGLRDLDELAARLQRLEAQMTLLFGADAFKPPEKVRPVAQRVRDFLKALPLSDNPDLLRHIIEESKPLRELVYRTETLVQGQQEIKDLLLRYMIADSLGLPHGAMRLPRFIPVRVWVSSAHSASLTEALDDLLKGVGFSGRELLLTESGSWFGRWVARSREALTQDEVSERLRKLERAVELGVLHSPQAAVDEKQAAAAARLIDSLQSIRNAAVQAGSLLIVKVTNEDGPQIVVRNLTQRELIAIEQNEHLLSDPTVLLKRLSQVAIDSGPLNVPQPGRGALEG